ncbi:glycosyltransferase [Cognatilysobacter xinjiangensis]|uniref:glycosyltransferase n=1 Tax=Cognatilysobacter xinjiangensis TaxID=546892 RepID=UPI00227D8E12|nr:glycosyltransferase [Lysobacter xinjiangensis]
MTPRISVALSTYNGARYLREQIDSVLAQEGVDLELVCVDDGSSDDTPAILAEYAARDPRVSWSANPRNLGPTASFERAMSLCRGEFIAPCDQDDYCEPGKLRTLLAAIGDADLAYCDSRYMDGDGRDLGCRVSGHMRMLEGRRPVEFLFGNSVSGHASLVRRSLFEQARPFPEGVYHDWWLALCAAGRNGVRYVPEPLVRFRRHCDAYSPMGHKHKGMGKRCESANWLKMRGTLAQAYAARDFRDADVAARLHADLSRALDGGTSAPLLTTLWSQRAAAPHWSGRPGLDALRLWTRFAKKLRRARAVA